MENMMNGTDEDAVPYDIERMKYVLSCPSITVPPGLSSEELDAFILSKEAEVKTANEEFCSRLLIEARRYGWSGDYLEVIWFVEDVFEKLGVELPKQEDKQPF